MRLLVTGGSSFVGAHFCMRAAPRHEVVALHHATPLRLNGVTPLRVDLRLARDRRRISALDFDAVVHIACKIKAWAPKGEHSGEMARKVNRQMMDTVLALGRPVVYASSTVVHWKQDSPYACSRREDEQRLADSGLPWAVVRPSAPYGRRLLHHVPRHRESFHTLVDLIRKSPCVPVIGDGRYRRQPVHVADFSDAILSLLDEELPGRAFEAGGGSSYQMNEIVEIIAAAMHRGVRPVHIPKAVFVQLSRFSKDFDPDLIAAADEDEVADPTELGEVTGVNFRTFSEGVGCLI
jgi:nucleoside-diphosphate-sugar epimerase